MSSEESSEESSEKSIFEEKFEETFGEETEFPALAWEFKNAPEELQNLSTFDGHEQFIALIPPMGSDFEYVIGSPARFAEFEITEELAEKSEMLSKFIGWMVQIFRRI